MFATRIAYQILSKIEHYRHGKKETMTSKPHLLM